MIINWLKIIFSIYDCNLQVGQYFSIQEARSFFDPDPGDKFTFFAVDGGTGQKNAFVNFVTWELAVSYGYDVDMDGNSNNITIQLMVSSQWK